MNLRSIANAATRAINPNTPITLKQSAGYTIDPVTRKQVPAYIETSGTANIQALSSSDVAQVQGLNIQGNVRAAYLYGDIVGVVRPDQKGGDLLVFNSQTWLVVKVLETWPDWCKVVINYQGAA